MTVTPCKCRLRLCAHGLDGRSDQIRSSPLPYPHCYGATRGHATGRPEAGSLEPAVDQPIAATAS